MKCAVLFPTYDRAREPIRKSLIRFDLERRADAERANQRAREAGSAASTRVFENKAQTFLQFGAAAVSPCLSFASLLIFRNNLSSQENVTLPCQL